MCKAFGLQFWLDGRGVKGATIPFGCPAWLVKEAKNKRSKPKATVLDQSLETALGEAVGTERVEVGTLDVKERTSIFVFNHSRLNKASVAPSLRKDVEGHKMKVSVQHFYLVPRSSTYNVAADLTRPPIPKMVTKEILKSNVVPQTVDADKAAGKPHGGAVCAEGKQDNFAKLRNRGAHLLL